MNSPYCLSYNSYDASLENLTLDKLKIPLLIFLFILITCQLDVVLILRRDILSWLLLGVKELNKINQLYSRKKTMILAKFTQVYQWVGPDEVEVTNNFQAINNCLFLDFGMLSLVLVSTVTVVCPSA